MSWLEIQVRTTPEAEEAVANLFYDAGAQGVVIESGDNLILIQDDPTINYIDEQILSMDPKVSLVRGYLSKEWDTDKGIYNLIDGIRLLPSYGLNPGDCELSIKEVEENDWANSWKEFYKPTRVGKNIVIKPTWEDYTPDLNEIIVNMDPGMAFGTGTHETTKLCIVQLERYVKSDSLVLDIGCGTGILSIIAVELGAKKVIGVDIDPVAVQVAKDNIERNKMADIVDIREGNLVDVISDDEKADVIVANIMANAIIALSGKLKPFLKESGYFIASGIINDALNEVLAALENEGFIVEIIEKMGEWNVVSARPGK